MGLFSKKDYVCEKCGKTFTKRINLNGNICDECFQSEIDERANLENPVKGYVDYARDIFGFGKEYTLEELADIANNRKTIMDKYKKDDGITKQELRSASSDYKQLSESEAIDIATRALASTYSTTLGAAYANGFFVPTTQDGIIVDAEDVFAAVYTGNIKVNNAGNSKVEVLLCLLFTNDPYVPVFPMIYQGKKSFFELSKSKKGREGLSGLLEAMCPNLTYTVDDAKLLKKCIKAEGTVHGNLSVDFVLEQIDKATSGKGIYDFLKITDKSGQKSKEILNKMGYMSTADIADILELDSMIKGKFWRKQLENAR